MKKYKLLFLVILVVILTGCQSTTSIIINKDLSVSEETWITQDTEFWNNFYKTSPASLINEALSDEKNKKFLIDNNYTYRTEISNSFKGVILEKNYSSLEEYSSNSALAKIPFDKLIYQQNGNIISVKTEGFNSYQDIVEDLDAILVKYAKISVSVPYIVTEHNADKVDKVNNVFTWEIDKETTEKSIVLEFDQSRLFIKHLDLYISLGIILLLLSILGVWYLKIRKSNKINNRI